MPPDIRDSDLEPAWLWATRVTAEAARAALVEGRTPQQRFAIYERLIVAACEQPRHPEMSQGSSAFGNADPPFSSYSLEDSINISKFENIDATS